MVALVIVPARATAALVSSVTPVWPVTVEHRPGERLVPLDDAVRQRRHRHRRSTLLPAVIVSAVDPLALVLDTAV